MASTSPANLWEYLELSAACFSERVAVVDSEGAFLTYRELAERANIIASFLRHCGVSTGDRVGLALPKTMEAVTAVFGILRSGAAYVPVDCAAPTERIASILADCQVRAAFIDASQDVLATTAETIIVVGDRFSRNSRSSRLHVFDWQAVLSARWPDVEAPDSRSEHLAYILYTSGSTGRPKGVMLTHENAVSFVQWCSETFCPTEEDRFSSHAPFHFDLSILDLFLAIKHGACVHLISEPLGKNPKALCRFINERKVTVWYSTPTTLALLAEVLDPARSDFSHLRLVLFAGEVFPVKQLRQLSSRWPSATYYNLYGPTETNVCMYARISTPIPQYRTEPYPIGWPCSHCATMVLDLENYQPVPRGREGLLFVKGPSVFSGYWERPADTNRAFLLRDGARWYNTGDIVKRVGSEGFAYVGRRDRMVKRRGYRIELAEIEHSLYQHADIADAAVVAIAQPDTSVRIVAYLVTFVSRVPSVIEMRMFCKQHLPGYMVPDIFIFVDALPRTSTNKVDYQVLRRKEVFVQSLTDARNDLPRSRSKTAGRD